MKVKSKEVKPEDTRQIDWDALTKDIKKLTLSSVKKNVPKIQSNDGDHHDDEDFEYEGFPCLRNGANKNPLAEDSLRIAKFITSDLGVLSINDEDLEELVDILVQIVA